MQVGWMAALASLAVLGGCASAQGMDHGSMGAMGQGAMNHEEMMRHCQMMQAHHGDGAEAPAEHDPAQHGGMSHEEMMRHCAQMREPAEEATPQHDH